MTALTDAGGAGSIYRGTPAKSRARAAATGQNGPADPTGATRIAKAIARASRGLTDAARLSDMTSTATSTPPCLDPFAGTGAP